MFVQADSGVWLDPQREDLGLSIYYDSDYGHWVLLDADGFILEVRDSRSSLQELMLEIVERER